VADDILAAGLRKWTARLDGHVRAAVDLLIEDGRWLRRPDFTRSCLTRHENGIIRVDWLAARGFARSGDCSTTEQAIMFLAAAIAENEYRLTRMDDRQAELIVRAFAGALGVDVLMLDGMTRG
jgi:hypothetical protein